MTYIPGAITFNSPVASEALDAFARLNVSLPVTLFDSKLLYDKQVLLWDEAITNASGLATSTHSVTDASVTMHVGNGDSIIRQTRTRWNYQPGKGQLVIMTGVLGVGVANTIARMGAFDASNGVFFERNASTYNVVVRKATGDLPVAQSAWNVDKFNGTGPSGLTIDFAKAQIFFMLYEWLGVGSVAFGFFVNGVPRFCHVVQNFNILTSVYMSTPNNPLRYQITSTGGTADLVEICGTVVSQGGREPTGLNLTGSMGNTFVNANTAGTLYAVFGIRLKSTNLSMMARPIGITMIADGTTDFEWYLVMNPTVAGGLSWADVANSSMQRGLPDTAGNPSTTTISAYTARIAGGYVKSSQQAGSEHADVASQIWLGSSIAGVVDECVLAVMPLANSADMRGGITWQELH
jgi:hypothetical protein